MINTVDILNYVKFGTFEFWVAWLIGLFFVFLALVIILTCFFLIYIFFISPLFENYCKKHGYVKSGEL